MALHDELIKLHEVQKVDTQIYQRECALKALDNGDALKAQAIAVMKRHDAAKAELQKAESAQRNKELELKGLEQKRATVHEKLYSGRVTNPKELADMEKDENMIAGQIGHMEDEVLELMEGAETARAAEAALHVEVDRLKRRYQDTVKHFTSETARLKAEIAALQPKRAQLAAEVEKPLLRRYDEIRLHSEGVGLSVTGSDNCIVCHVKLTPLTMQRLRAGEELTACDNCARILLYLPNQ